jgi:hypothetical protein
VTPWGSIRGGDRRAEQLIVGRLMREFALWWPQSVNVEDYGLVVLDLSQSQIHEMRVSITSENCEIAVLAMRWLIESGKVKYTRTKDVPVMELTHAGLDCLNSLDAFRRHCQAQSRAEQEEIVPDLDRELVESLGPPFLGWLTASRAMNS